MAVKLSSDESAALQQSVNVSADADDDDDFASPDLGRQFGVDGVVRFIRDGQHRNVVLQLPDELLHCSQRLVELVKAGLADCPVQLYIAADTTHASCCVDVITARHVNATGVVHFGDACLSQPPSNLPVHYVLPACRLDVDQVIEKLSTTFIEKLSTTFASSPDADNKQQPVVLLYDLCYHHCRDALLSGLRSRLPNVSLHCAEPVLPAASVDEEDKNSQSAPSTSPSSSIELGRRMHPPLPPDTPHTCLYVGRRPEASPLLPLYLMARPHCATVVSHIRGSIAVDRPRCIRSLRRRLFLIEQLKDAATVGLVASGVSVKHHLPMLNRLRRLCAEAGKQSYTFSIGKLNVAKLANFADQVDVFVLLSCPFGVVLDTSDHVRPLLAAFEAECALGNLRGWAAHSAWIGEFDRLLAVQQPDVSLSADGEEEGDVSLVSGRVRLKAEPMDPTKQQLLVYDPGSYAAGRSWTGLVDTVGLDVPVEPAVDGRAGVAAGYTNEKQ